MIGFGYSTAEPVTRRRILDQAVRRNIRGEERQKTQSNRSK